MVSLFMFLCVGVDSLLKLMSFFTSSSLRVSLHIGFYVGSLYVYVLGILCTQFSCSGLCGFTTCCGFVGGMSLRVGNDFGGVQIDYMWVWM